MGWAQKIMVALHYIEITFLLNILWIVGFIIGLGLFGAFPSSRSVFLLIKQGVLEFDNGQTAPEIIMDFIGLYRNTFLKINLFAIIYGVIYMVLIFDFNAVSMMPTQLKVFFMTLLIVLLCYVFLTNIYLLMSERIRWSKPILKRIMVMPIAFPIASTLFCIFVVILSLLAIRFSFIIIAFYFSGIILIQEYFLSENIRRHLAPKN